jgi:predicted 3-demethylubiquinone-9 3-methyltransferase (glyoxalase superfamily)
MQKITPFLWFDKEAEEAADFYTSVFKDSKKGRVARYGDAGPGAPGSVMTCEFTIAGMQFVALNAGPLFKFNESVSFVIDCKDQEEVDYYWNKLTADGGQESMCGWLKDKYGLSWQVTPFRLSQMMQDKDPQKAANVMHAMLQMRKIDIQKLEDAYAKG